MLLNTCNALVDCYQNDLAEGEREDAFENLWRAIRLSLFSDWQVDKKQAVLSAEATGYNLQEEVNGLTKAVVDSIMAVPPQAQASTGAVTPRPQEQGKQEYLVGEKEIIKFFNVKTLKTVKAWGEEIGIDLEYPNGTNKSPRLSHANAAKIRTSRKKTG